MSQLKTFERNTLRYLVLCLMILAHSSVLIAQSSSAKYDQHCVLGNGGTSIIAITADSLNVTRINNVMDFFQSSATMSDSAGNLIFYTNGFRILNRNHTQMQPGLRINPSKVLDDLNFTDFGLPFLQGLISVPLPNNTYYILNTDLHFKTYADYPVWVCSAALYYQKIDMNKNGGLGQVVESNVLISSDTIEVGNLVACRHANGRDWWILINEVRSTAYRTYLLTEQGIELKKVQTLHKSILVDSSRVKVAQFTPDGRKFVRLSDDRTAPQLLIIDFDRCTGDLGTIQNLKVKNKSVLVGTSISPNSRFLYITRSEYVLQYDLEAPDIEASLDTVAVYDGYIHPNIGVRTIFAQSWLGPDGKIYFITGEGTEYLHVIEQPNLKGKSCSVKQRAINLKVTNNGTTPNFPNYRLGPLKGSPCDTLSVSTKELSATEYGLKLFPSPASDRIQIDINLPYYDPATKTEVVIADVSGQIVQKYIMPDYAYLATLDIAKLASGVYAVQLRQRNKVLAVEKLVVVR